MIQIDIDMPRRCEECPLCVDYDCIIHKRITDEYFDSLNEQYAHCPLTMPSAQQETHEERTETHACDLIYRQAAIDVADAIWSVTGDKNVAKVWDQLKDLPSAQPDYTEMKQEFLRMASYIDVLLECSDEQKETLIGFISRLAEFMPWTEMD